MVAWWSGDIDGSDISGNGNHAVLTNGASAGAPGIIGGAFLFDGVDDIALTPLVLLPQGTIDFWVKPSYLEGPHGFVGTFGRVAAV